MKKQGLSFSKGRAFCLSLKRSQQVEVADDFLERAIRFLIINAQKIVKTEKSGERKTKIYFFSSSEKQKGFKTQHFSKKTKN